MSRIAVLMYHGIVAGRRSARFVLPLSEFERQMRWIREAGRPLVGLQEVVMAVRGDARIADSAVAVTFDDGHQSFSHHALPILEELGIPATMFVVAGKLGGTDDWMPADTPRKPLMTAEQVAELPSRGVSVGSHSATHANLPALGDAALRHELIDSRARLCELLGSDVDLLAYPFGRYDERVIEFAREAGYLAACSTRSGFNSEGTDPMALRRVDVYGTDSLRAFRHKLELGVNDGSIHARLGYYGRRLRNALQPTKSLELRS